MKHPDFAERFNQAVALSGVESTQKALGKMLKVSDVMIWSYRNGEKLPRMAMALRMAKVFGVSVDWLLQGNGEPVNLSIQQKGAKYHIEGLCHSTRSIINFVETLTEEERKKALKILHLAFMEQ